jgi:MFS transporter, ACS family, DAL5 transporter family protein
LSKGTETFQPKDAPGYIPGKIAILVLLSAQIFFSFLLRWINLRLNKKRSLALEEHKQRQGWTDKDVERERQKHAFLDMTDKQ